MIKLGFKLVVGLFLKLEVTLVMVQGLKLNLMEKITVLTINFLIFLKHHVLLLLELVVQLSLIQYFATNHNLLQEIFIILDLIIQQVVVPQLEFPLLVPQIDLVKLILDYRIVPILVIK